MKEPLERHLGEELVCALNMVLGEDEFEVSVNTACAAVPGRVRAYSVVDGEATTVIAEARVCHFSRVISACAAEFDPEEPIGPAVLAVAQRFAREHGYTFVAVNAESRGLGWSESRGSEPGWARTAVAV